MNWHRNFRPIGLLLAAVMVIYAVAVVAAEEPANSHFDRTWSRTDLPVHEGQVSRTWMWGPEAFTGEMSEPYLGSPGGERSVQYFDKSRMEISHPNADPNSIWYVTNGLLVVELVTGRLQTGDGSFEQYSPAEVNVAGDADDANGPTYATFNGLINELPLESNAVISWRLSRDGTITDDPSMAGYGVTATEYVEATDHQVASPFWEFMNSYGLVYEDGAYKEDALFQNPFYATGLPITEAYWATVLVGGVDKDVLVQCFERRCLTYTPDNPEGWQVEAGNVGRHYYQWRYEIIDSNAPDDADPEETTTETATEEETPSQTAVPEPTATATETEDPEPTATIEDPVAVRAAIQAGSEELASCLSDLVTAETLLDLAAGNSEATANAVNSCLAETLPPQLADALNPLVDQCVECMSDAVSQLSIEELNTLANGTPEEQEALVIQVIDDTIDCLIASI